MNRSIRRLCENDATHFESMRMTLVWKMLSILDASAYVFFPSKHIVAEMSILHCIRMQTEIRLPFRFFYMRLNTRQTEFRVRKRVKNISKHYHNHYI